MISIDENQFEAWNESMSKKYDPDHYHRSSNAIIRFVEGRRTKKIISFLNPQPNDKIIELGCGAGNILEKIKTGERWGVDLSDFLLDKARKLLPGAHLCKGNIEQLPAEIHTNKFNKIYCSEVLEHVLHPEKVMDEIMTIATEDATIVLSVPNEKLIEKIKTILRKLNIFHTLFPAVQDKATDEWHIHEFDLELLRRYTEGKLKIKTVAAAPFSFVPLRYIVKCSPSSTTTQA